MDFMKLKATLSLDSSEYEQGLDKAESKTGKLKKGLANFGKVSAVAVGAASAAIGALTKQSISAYAEYEQLKGGVEKLFGKDASAEIMKYANDAYRTAGMSANQYMEQATSFSAALINSLGGDQMKAAAQTDVAMRAISDNFNTFGGDISNVQNAFQGFAKQNYTMLDNLKLGYGGTKTEMERLIADANEYAKANGMAADLSINSFSDIVTAIDLIQQKQGIAGTTAAEAAKTIEGSFNMTKAAWQNLVAGFANPDADMGQLMDNLIVAIVGDKDGTGLLNNVIPAIQRAVEGIGKLLQKAIPALAQKLPSLIQTFLPVIVQSATTLVTSLIQALPSILTTLVNMLPDLVQTALTALTDAIVTVTPQLLKAIWQMLKTAVTAFSKINWLELGSKAFNKVKSGIEKIKPKIETLIDQLVRYVLDKLGFTGIKEKVSQAFEKAKSAITDKLDAAKNKVTGWISTIKGLFPFNIGKVFSGWIPKISLRTNKSGDSASTDSSVSEQHFAKAMNQPYLFTKKTLFNQYAGEAGDEMLYGRSALMKDIAEAVGASGGNQIINYISIYDATNPEEVAEAITNRLSLQLRSA